MAGQSRAEVNVGPEGTFPAPLHDTLGLSQDPIFVSAHEVDGVQQFALVHSRPLSGESMYAFLHASTPYRSGYQTRLHAAAQYASLGEKANIHSADDFERRQERLHRGIGSFGIGSAFRAFAKEVRDEWIDALKEPSTDIYAPLTKMFAAYTDLGAAANAQIGRWKAKIEQGDNFSDLATSQSVSRALRGFGLYTDRLEVLDDTYQTEYDAEWKSTRQPPVHAPAAFNSATAQLLANLTPEETTALIGRAYSEYTQEGLHYPGSRLIIDLCEQRYWRHVPEKYGEGYMCPLTKTIDIRIADNNMVVLQDPDSETFVQLDFTANPDPTQPARWSIVGYALPAAMFETGRYAAVAWQRDQSGKRQFLSHEETTKAIRASDMPVAGTPDSYLGKLLIKYFGQGDEYPEIPEERKWQTEMGIVNPSSKDYTTRRIAMRELPVWIQLPQHQQDLLASQFIRAAEASIQHGH